MTVGDSEVDTTTDLMTDEEHHVLDLTAQLWNALVAVMQPGRSAARDMGELVAHVHAIQHAILSQAAARAYPQRYRLLGASLASTPQGFTCPRCHRTSYNENDLREGYCGACHDWTGVSQRS